VFNLNIHNLMDASNEVFSAVYAPEMN
jgi:hypothetical protein